MLLESPTFTDSVLEVSGAGDSSFFTADPNLPVLLDANAAKPLVDPPVALVLVLDGGKLGLPNVD